jgi:hypothetical protein
MSFVDGEPKMVSLQGRDPVWTTRAMAELFSRATERNLIMYRWQLGFFNLRDLENARAIGHRDRPYTRTEMFWGCDVDVVSLEDTVALLARDGTDVILLQAEEGKE